MTTDATQDAGTATNDAGGTQQNDAGQKPAGTEQTADTTQAVKAEGEGAKEEKATEEAVYDFKVPDGIEIDAAMADEFKAIAKELKLPPEHAQKAVDLVVRREQARAEQFAAQVQSWADEVKADPELGKPENLAAARKFIDTFGDDKIKSLLNNTGMGNHPDVVRLILKASKGMSEDRFVAGKSNAEPSKRDPASVLYGNP